MEVPSLVGVGLVPELGRCCVVAAVLDAELGDGPREPRQERRAPRLAQHVVGIKVHDGLREPRREVPLEEAPGFGRGWSGDSAPVFHSADEDEGIPSFGVPRKAVEVLDVDPRQLRREGRVALVFEVGSQQRQQLIPFEVARRRLTVRRRPAHPWLALLVVVVVSLSFVALSVTVVVRDALDVEVRHESLPVFGEQTVVVDRRRHRLSLGHRFLRLDVQHFLRSPVPRPARQPHQAHPQVHQRPRTRRELRSRFEGLLRLDIHLPLVELDRLLRVLRKRIVQVVRRGDHRRRRRRQKKKKIEPPTREPPPRREERRHRRCCFFLR
mmetsp:Transcript_10772/g.35702  ORF Transcript_10772/g.35702 Transcript_10772/m.35702 type:complete len:325 (+) Transcript_10772:1719-2693(+)